jgi:hypothetical protein
MRSLTYLKWQRPHISFAFVFIATIVLIFIVTSMGISQTAVTLSGQVTFADGSPANGATV